MPTTRLPLAHRILLAVTGPEEDTAPAGQTPVKGRRCLIALGVISILVVGIALVEFGVFTSPSQGAGVSTSTTTSTFYVVSAPAIIASAAPHVPSGYVEGSSKQLSPKETGLSSAGYAAFSNQGTALANMTVLVFNSTTTAQTYVDSVIANSKDLSGYTDITVSLASFQHYGTCYGFGETDPDGAGAVATGVCTKGNVYIQVFVASNSSLPSVQEDMSGFVGAAYQGTG